jgi:hypothetical protein
MDPLPNGIELVVEDVSDALPRNVSVESAEAVRTEIRPDSHVTVRTVLRNHGPLSIRKLQVRCDVEGNDGEKLSVTQETDINGRGSVVLDFPLQIQRDGLYRGQIAIEIDDALVLDNRRWIGFEARHPDRVLLVDGQEGRSNFGNETYFLETALRLQTEDTSGLLRSFEPDKMVWETGEGFPKLDGYRAVVLANLRRLSKPDGERLEAYVRSGGNLLIFAGDQVTPESLGPLADHGLLPGKVASTPIEGRLRIDQWDAKHPALACFSDPQQGDLRRVELRKILPLSGIGPTSRMLLQSGGHLVAAELAVDKGRVIYFACTADREWTDLPRTPMYVPLMRQLLAHLTDQLEARSAVTRKFVTHAGEKTGIVSTVDASGHWTVINLDPRESALDRVGPEVLQKLAGAPELNAEEEAQQAALKIQLPADSLRPDEIWPTVTWILLAVLAAEMLLAGKVHA